MPAPTMPLIADFLESRPRGASLEEIANFLTTTNESAGQSLQRMKNRGQAQFDGSVWKLVRVETPPVFRAIETLKAMQAVAGSM